MNYSFKTKRQLKLEDEAPIEGSTSAPEAVKPEADPVDGVEALKKVLEKERESAKAAKKEAAKFRDELKVFQEKFANVDPAQYAALLKEREALASKQSEQERLQAEMSAKFDTDRIKLTETYNAQLAQMQSESAALQQQLLALSRSQLLEKEFMGANGRTEISDGISYFKVLDNFVGNKFKLSDDKTSLIVTGDDGNPMMSIEDPKVPMTPKEYLKSLHRHEVLGSCFKLESVPSGSGQNTAIKLGGIPTTAPKTSRAQQLLEARQEG